MPTISVIIITFNEAEKIERCLESVLWADEIIVLDSNSSDDTRERCAPFTSQVYTTDWPGYGPQKNRALSLAESSWVLSLDADEVISDDLTREIQHVIKESEFEGYSIPRLTTYCGKFLHHGGWWPDYTTRLFRREHGKFSDNRVHERLIIEGQISKLKNPILHYRSDSLDDTLDRMNRYSTIWSQEHQHKRKGGLFIGFLHAFWHFNKTYFLRAGFRDGREGLLMAISSSIGSFYKYVKLYYLNHE